MTTTPNLGLTLLESGLRQPEVVINSNYLLLDAVSADSAIFTVEQFGGVGDGVTDDTAAFQAAFDAIEAAGGGTLVLQLKEYIIAGALQDTGLSNSQLVLPKVGYSEPMVSIRLLGQVPPAGSLPRNGEKCTMIRSTLTSGSGGAMIGVKASNGSGTGSQNEIAHNAESCIMFSAENINFRMPANPTRSCLDLRFIPDVYLNNIRIDVQGITVPLTSGVIPDLTCTEPTTSTSYGLLTPIDYIPHAVKINNLEILGYYNGMRWGELISLNNLTIGLCKVGIEFRGAAHASVAQKILFVATASQMKAAGLDPFFSSGNTTNQIDIQQLDFENATGATAWANTTSHIDDPSDLLIGDITWASGFTLLKTGGANLKMHQTNKPWHLYRPFSNITGADLDLGDHAVHEIYRGLATSTSSRIAHLLLTSKQSGTAHGIGIIAFNNDVIADGGNKKLGQIDVITDGATNTGKMTFSVTQTGTLTSRMILDQYGNLIFAKMLIGGEGAALTISSNTIAPTSRHHTVGAGLLKTITLPSGPGSSVVHEVVLIPTAAFTYDATGNILVASGSGTAVINKPMIATWMPSLSKWVMSY